MTVEVFQTDERYAGPVFADRFQVLASAVGPTFYVYDHAVRDSVRARSGDVLRFDEIIHALSLFGFTIQNDETKKDPSADVADIQEVQMGKAVKVSEAMARAQASMTARVAAKRAAAGPADKAAGRIAAAQRKSVAATERKAASKVEKAPAPTAKVAPVAKGQSQAAMFRAMIAEGKLDDKAMLEVVRKAFPDKKVVESSVTFYRARMG